MIDTNINKLYVYSLFANLVWFWFSGLKLDGNVNDLMNVKNVDLTILRIYGSMCVGFKSSMSDKFLSQTGVLCFTYIHCIVFNMKKKRFL